VQQMLQRLNQARSEGLDEEELAVLATRLRTKARDESLRR